MLRKRSNGAGFPCSEGVMAVTMGQAGNDDCAVARKFAPVTKLGKRNL